MERSRFLTPVFCALIAALLILSEPAIAQANSFQLKPISFSSVSIPLPTALYSDSSSDWRYSEWGKYLIAIWPLVQSWLIFMGIITLIWVIWVLWKPEDWDWIDKQTLEEFGHTKKKRRKNIEQFFSEPLNTLICEIEYRSRAGERLRCAMERNFLTMTNLEKELVKACYLLGNEGGFAGKDNFYILRFALLYGNHQGQLLSKNKIGSKNIFPSIDGDVLAWFANQLSVTPQGAVSTLLREIEQAYAREPSNAVYKQLYETFAGDQTTRVKESYDSEENVVEF